MIFPEWYTVLPAPKGSVSPKKLSVPLSRCLYRSDIIRPEPSFTWTSTVTNQNLHHSYEYRVAQKTGQTYQIFWKLHDRIAWQLVNFCNITCWTQSLTFLFKKFTALWRHLAKTQLLRETQIYLYSVNKRQYAAFSLGSATTRWNF